VPISRPTPDEPPALRAAREARAIAGDEAAAGDDARRDAFCAFLYGLALGFAGRDDDPMPLADRVDALATRLARDAVTLPFREACRVVEAVADVLASGEPDPAVAGLVQAGVAAAADWQDGDARGFAQRVLQATAGESFASDRALRPRR
jgi:hypothetical protein